MDAKVVMAKHHANGDMDDPLVQWEFEETVAAIEAEAEQKKSSYVSSVLSAAADYQLDFTRTKPNRRRLLVCITCGAGTNMNGVGIVSWFLAPVLDQLASQRLFNYLRSSLVFLSGTSSSARQCAFTPIALVVDRSSIRQKWG